MREIKEKDKQIKLKTVDMEIALARYFNIRTNLIVPNISWGLFNHECDLVIATKSRCAWEIEIKISKADLIKDKKKRHGHYSPKIKFLYFAIPDYLQEHIEHVPDRAGIIIVHRNLNCEIIRKPKQNGNYKLTEKEYFNVARLGTMRIWRLKEKLNNSSLNYW